MPDRTPSLPLRLAATGAVAIGAVGLATTTTSDALIDRRLQLSGEYAAGPTCGDSTVGYSLNVLGEVPDGGGVDAFGVLVIDGDGTVLDLDVHRVPVGTPHSELHDADLSGRATIDHRQLELRLVDLGFVPAVGTENSSLVVSAALGSPTLTSRVVDLGLVLPPCASLPLVGGGADPMPLPPAPVCAVVASNPFVDLDPAGAHTPNVVCAAHRDLVRGGPNGLPAVQFGPTFETSRAQLASMVWNLLQRVGVPAPTAAPDAFADDEGSVHEASIDILDALGVVGGNGELGSSFVPGRSATRSEMASFLHRSYEAAVGVPLPAGPNTFIDDDGDPAEADIDALAAAGVLSGKGPGVFDPAGVVTREQIATFFVRLLGRVVADMAGA